MSETGRKRAGIFLRMERKRAGMTRRQLAMELGVTTELERRWEHGLEMPVLSMLPLIADVLGLSASEVLNATKLEPGISHDSPEHEKIVRRMLVYALSDFRKYNFLCVMIAFVGIVSSMVLWFAFRLPFSACLVSFLFTAMSFICESFSVRNACSAIDKDALKEDRVALYKGSVIRLSMRGFTLAFILFSFNIPLLFVDSGALDGDVSTLFMSGFFSAFIAFMISITICYLVHGHLIMKDSIPMKGEDRENYFFNHRLLGKIMVLLVATILVTSFAEWYFTRESFLLRPVVFENYEDFIEYMERDYRSPYAEKTGTMERLYLRPGEGWKSEEQALRKVLRDRQGDVVVSYLDRNRNVWEIRYDVKDGTILPIEVYTYPNVRAMRKTGMVIHAVFAFLYAGEMLCYAVIYLKKRKDRDSWEMMKEVYFRDK